MNIIYKLIYRNYFKFLYDYIYIGENRHCNIVGMKKYSQLSEEGLWLCHWMSGKEWRMALFPFHKRGEVKGAKGIYRRDHRKINKWLHTHCEDGDLPTQVPTTIHTNKMKKLNIHSLLVCFWFLNPWNIWL